MNELTKYEMPNGEIIEVWSDGELKLDLSLEEPFEYYYNFMLSVHEVELKP